MKKGWIVLLCGLIGLNGCSEVIDESTLVTDDNGVVHRTLHYSKDKRGEKVFPLTIKTTEKQFIFDPKAHAWAAYDEQGNRVMTGSASGGNTYCEDVKQACHTVVGTFRVYNRRGEGCRSGQYPVETLGGAKMPYCMYFYRGYTIHAAYDVPHANVSHGCIRVLPSAAKWLYDDFLSIGTKVTVLAYPGNEDKEPA